MCAYWLTARQAACNPHFACAVPCGRLRLKRLVLNRAKTVHIKPISSSVSVSLPATLTASQQPKRCFSSHRLTRSLSTRVRSTQEPMTVKRRNHGRSKPAGARGRVKRVRAALTKNEGARRCAGQRVACAGQSLWLSAATSWRGSVSGAFKNWMYAVLLRRHKPLPAARSARLLRTQLAGCVQQACMLA